MTEEKNKEVKVPEKFKKLVEEIEKMSVMDLAELVKILEDKFGVSAVVPTSAGVGPPTSPEVSVGEEKTSFNLELKSGGEQKIQVIKVLREITGLGLKEAKDLVEGAPKVVKENIKKELSRVSIPKYDPTKDPVYDINDIKRLLPHRYPFLLIDKIIHMDDKQVIGVKNVTMNENFFLGHFPTQPIMPGVLQVEAMAQVGGILALSKVEDPENYQTLFLRIDKVKFKKMVIPGDTIIFRLELLAPIRRGLVNMFGQAFVGNDMVMEGELMAQVSKVK